MGRSFSACFVFFHQVQSEAEVRSGSEVGSLERSFLSAYFVATEDLENKGGGYVR